MSDLIMKTLPKYLAKDLAQTQWPQILILKDKHETEYFLLSNEEDLYVASLEVLAERVKTGYICPPGEKPYGIKDGELGEEEIAQLPEPYQKQAWEISKNNKRARAVHTQETDFWNAVQTALKTKHGTMAYQILHFRQDYEYEGFRLEAPRIPGKKRGRA